MGRERKINLGKNDDKLKTWFMAADNKRISRIVCAAVEYYETTGEYLVIGTLNTVNKELPNTRKVIYVPDNSEANSIFQNWEKEKRTVSTIIKRILNMGIKIDYECSDSHVIEEDEAITVVESLKRKAQNIVVIPEKEHVAQTMSTEKEETQESHAVKEPIAQENGGSDTKGVTNPVQDREDRDMEERAQNLIASMLGKGCGLGNS